MLNFRTFLDTSLDRSSAYFYIKLQANSLPTLTVHNCPNRLRLGLNHLVHPVHDEGNKPFAFFNLNTGTTSSRYTKQDPFYITLNKRCCKYNGLRYLKVNMIKNKE